MTEEDVKKHLNIVQAHVARLRDAGYEHVQIFAGKYDGKEGTYHWAYGDGDYLARVGHVMLWLEKERAAEWAKEIKRD